MNPANENYLCIDIGTNSIRALEKDAGGRVARWGALEIEEAIHSAIKPIDPGSTAPLLGQVIQKMGSGARDAVFAVPSFYFFTAIAEEIDPSLIPAHPKTYFLKAYPTRDGRYFLTAVPREVIARYKILAKLAGLNFLGWESESSSLARQFRKIKGKTLIVVPDIRSTTFTLVDRGEVSYLFRSDFGFSLEDQLRGSVGDVIMNIVKEISKNRGADRILVSNSVFNVPNGLQKISS